PLAASLLSSSGLSSLHPDIITLPLTPDIITLVQHSKNWELTNFGRALYNFRIMSKLHRPFIEPLKSLEEAKEKINKACDVVRTRVPVFRYTLGTWFIQVKALCGHGNWEDWVRENVMLIAPRTAAAYMEYARRCDEEGTLVRYSKSADSAVLKDLITPSDYVKEKEPPRL